MPRNVIPPSLTQSRRAARALSLALLLCVLGLLGCGAERDGRPAEAPTTTRSPEVTTYEAWGADLAEPKLDGPVTLTQELAVFSRPRRPDDEFPGLFADARADTAEGRELPARSRLLLRGVAKESFDDIGEQQLSLYAVPTEHGWVCAYVVYEDLGDLADGMGGACEHGLVHGFGLELHGVGPAYRLYGIVEDGIERVSVSVGDRLLPARIGSNGIYFAADAREVCPIDIEHLVVERSDSRKTHVPWSELAPSLAAAGRETFDCAPA